MRRAASRALLAAACALLPAVGMAASADCRSMPSYRLAANNVAAGEQIVLQGAFGAEPAGRVFFLRRAFDVLWGDPPRDADIDLPTLGWRETQVVVGVPPGAAPAYYDLGVRCTNAREAAAPTGHGPGVLGFQALVRVRGDPGSLREKVLLAAEEFAQLRSAHAVFLLAGYLGFVLLFALPFARAALRTRPTVAGLTGAACNLSLAWTFATAWWNPAALGKDLVTWLVFLMILEFVLMHGSIMFAEHVMTRESPVARLKAMLLLGGAYSLFAGGISLAARSPWPLALLWATTLGRFLPALLRGPLAGERESHLARAAPGAVLYLFGAFFCLLYPLPPLGTTGAIRGHGGGLWLDEPYRALAFGAYYFFALALVELAAPAPAQRKVSD